MIVLRSLLSTTKAPTNYTIKPTNFTPPNKTVTTSPENLKGGTSIVTPSTWVNIRLVTRKGINLIMFTNGTVAGSWKQSLTTMFGKYQYVWYN